MFRLTFLAFACSIHCVLFAQLQPGFDKEEYKQLMYVSARTVNDSAYASQFSEPTDFRLVYRSPVIGLENLWDFWTDGKGTAAISIRGTTSGSTSWLVNLYAAMVPAKGTLQLSETETFDYELASHPQAAVHVGWLVSTAYLSKDMLPKIDSAYKSGTRDFLIMGHSQGGAIGFLLTAYLRNLQQKGRLSSDIRFKTYCSAGPKPGNLYFAYEYEAATQEGWAYNVVNSADWVPETPVSIQTVNDFNRTNPFANARQAIRKTPFPQRIALRHMFNKLDKPTRKAQKNYQRYLGDMTSKMVRKNLPEFEPPKYYESNHYVRTGQTIVLLADESYYQSYPDSKETIFVHHFHAPYLFLLEKL